MKEEDSISAMDKHLLVELPNGDMTIAEKIEPLPRVLNILSYLCSREYSATTAR